MPTVRKSVIVPHRPARMFALVDEVERYPDFLPWCAGTQVLERTDAVTHARIDVDFHGLKTSFTTCNRKEPPEWMRLGLDAGPFERFDGHWRFVPLGEEGCRVEFELDYGFDNRVLDAMLAPVFGQIMETLVDRFVVRAETEAKP